jgi:hypothetical protein
MVSPGGAYTQTALVDHCRLENNPYGLIVSTLNGDGTATVTVRNTVAANKREGFYAQGSRAQLNVFDSEAVHHSLGSGFHASGGAKINAQHCISSNNAYGFFAGGGVINAKDCTAAYNNGSGMQSTGLGSKLSAEGCQLVSNFTGLHVAFDATAIISDTLVTGNNIGLKNDPAHPGVLESFGNNRVRRNTDGTQGTITTAPQM